jgi:hypothetical protein
MNILDALDDTLRTGGDIRPVAASFFQLAGEADVDTKEQMLASLHDRIADHPAERVAVLAILAGALVETGADPRNYPPAVFDHLVRLLDPITGPDDEREMPEAYFMLEKGAMACLSRSAELRRSLPQKPALVARLRRYQERYGFLGKMLQVLDDEPLVVIHVESERGFRFKMSGIADNFQLHLLLLGALAGDGPDRIAGVVPSREAIAESEDGEWGDSSVVSKWQLANWSALRHGRDIGHMDYKDTWIWNEGVPADIEPFEGTRVVLVGPTSFERSWPANRVFPGMVGRLDGPTRMPDGEVRALLSGMTPRLN